MPMTTEELERAIRIGYERRDRANMGPTIAYFRGLLDADPDNPVLLYEVGGAYDTAGQESVAIGWYEAALAAGLEGAVRTRCLIQYGSTLRNLDRFGDSIRVLREAVAGDAASAAALAFLGLSLHAGGRSDAAVAALMRAVASIASGTDAERYRAALVGNAEHLEQHDLQQHGLEAD